MTRLFFLIGTFLLMTTPLFAQLKSGFKHLKKRDYPKALSAFQQTMQRGKPVEQTAA